MAKVRTKEIDHGFKGIIKELRKLEYKPFVKIGYPAESKKTNEEHVESEFVTVLDIAIWHEFGTESGSLPERSFIRSSFDNNRKKYEKLNKKLLERIYSGRMTVEKALDILGETILNDIKAFLKNNEVTPKSLRAIAQNGKTLVDTAQLMNSLTYKKVMRP